VAGVPSAIALEKIRDYETFDRGLYAAPIGWLDLHGNAEFMVGIRSAMIHNNHARLYAGAGIVAGSNPDKELAEVQLKLQAMLKALR
ncbi:MAG: chorismate-binding protein, partial [Halothece sp. Uz-M2-17]|nr:chorismate-binding protein [Halothece sp. Uz-M2-17]